VIRTYNLTLERCSLNRRRFLKYAGGTAAVVGASVVGLDYAVNSPQIPSQQTGKTLIPTSSSLATASVSSSSSTQLVSLQGTLFFDYNGNGIQDANEPFLQNVRVQMQDAKSQVIADALTDSSGDYSIDIPAGNYKLNIQPDSKFRCMCISPSDFKAVKDGYDLSVAGDSSFDIGLMEGFLTLPIRDSSILSEEPWYVDLDSRIGFLRDWKNGQHTTDQHLGTDFIMGTGNDIIAAAPGIVVDTESNWPNVAPDSLDDGNRITIDHGPSPGSFPPAKNSSWTPDRWNRTDFLTIYCHLDKVLVAYGQTVNRGDLIATSDNTGYKTKGPHLHFQAGNFGYGRVDPYRDILGIADHLSYWTKDNDPKYFTNSKSLQYPQNSTD